MGLWTTTITLWTNSQATEVLIKAYKKRREFLTLAFSLAQRANWLTSASLFRVLFLFAGVGGGGLFALHFQPVIHSLQFDETAHLHQT